MYNVELLSDRRTINPSFSTSTLQLILGAIQAIFTGEEDRCIGFAVAKYVLKRCGQDM